MPRMTLDQIDSALDKALNDKKIFNVDFVDLRDALTRLMGEAHDAAQEVYLKVSRQSYDFDPLSKAYYSTNYPHTLAAFAKKLPTLVEPKYEPALAAFRAYADTFTPVCEKFLAVKPFIVKGRKPAEPVPVEKIPQTKAEREKLETEKAALQTKVRGYRLSFAEKVMMRTRIKEINSLLAAGRPDISDTFNLLTSALAPAKEQAVAHAEKMAKERFAVMDANMAKADWDLERHAPKVAKELGGTLKEIRDALRQEYTNAYEIDTKRQAKWRSDNHAAMYTSKWYECPTYLKLSAKLRTQQIARAKFLAAQQFDAYVTKLTDKIGAGAAKVVYTGLLWERSTIVVTMKDGDVQNWWTQMIINYTRYGDPYYQWPTRPVKEV